METFDFHITSYDTEKLLQQVSEALEKRTELRSRERYPVLWENIDKLNAMSKGKRRGRLRSKVMSIICLGLGVFLVVPGLMKPQELFVPLLTGVFAVIVGFVYLFSSRKNRKNPFDKSAKLLLMGKDNISMEQSAAVAFSESGMEIRADDREPQYILYSDFESMTETADLFLFVHDTRVSVLQKKDLISKDITGFRSFISKNIPECQSISPDVQN